MYAIGGVGQGECYREPDSLALFFKEGTNCETCATYNLLKLARELYAFDPDDAGPTDYYERGLYNHILATQKPDGNEHETNAVTYMLPIGPGAEKEYSNDWRAFTCCHGTGMENHVKYPDAQQPSLRVPDRFALPFCGREFLPMYEIHGRPYHTYFKLKT